MTEIEISLKDIEIPSDRARDLDTAWAEALGALIKAQGLTNAITVRVLPAGGHILVTGLHRLEAHRSLFLDTIRARISHAQTDDEARLEEVMENLGRNELNALDRCHHLYELKQVYERIYPQAKHGGDRKSEIKRQALPLDNPSSEIFGFARDTAEKIGLSDRSIRMAVKIWTDLTQASRIRLAGSDLAKKQTELKLLSSQTAPIQKKVLDLVQLPEHSPTSIQEALDYLENGTPINSVERKFIAFTKTFSELPDNDLDRLVIAAEERIIASLKRRGRI